jgi:hypothetical protein
MSLSLLTPLSFLEFATQLDFDSGEDMGRRRIGRGGEHSHSLIQIYRGWGTEKG